jgi:DNA-binding MarR family transcriptional regulator
VTARRPPVVEPSTSSSRRSASPPFTRSDIGFLLARASRRWNELLAETFREAGYGDVRPAYGSVLVPLLEEDGLRIGELAERSHLAKQTMTTMVRTVARAQLVECRPDPTDARATRVHLTARGRAFRPIAARAVSDLEELVADRLGEQRTAALRAALSEVADLWQPPNDSLRAS